MESYTIRNIRVDAELSKTSEGISDSINYQFFYPVDNSEPLATGVLERDSSKEIDCKTADGFAIKGTVSWKLLKTYGITMYGGLNFGHDLKWTFEGIIFTFGFTESDPPTI